MKFERQKIILFITKYVSYTFNLVVVVAVVAGVAWWVQTLIQSAKMTVYH